MNVFTKALDRLSDRALRKEADRAQAVKAELEKREQVRATAEERADATARARRSAEKVAALRSLAASTFEEITTTTTTLDAALRALSAHERRDALLARHAGVLSELRSLRQDVPDPVYPGLTEEARQTAERVWTDLGISLGVAVVSRPLLTFK